MPDLLQILCAHCSGNQILVTWRYLFLRESNNAARCAGKCPNPQCLSALHGATRVFATPHLGHVTMPHACSTLALHLGNAPSAALGPPSPHPALHQVGPAQCCPGSTTSGPAPGPQRPCRAHSGPAPDPPCPTPGPQHPPVLSRDCSRSSKTKYRLGLQLFCDCGLSHGVKTQIEALKRSKNGIFQALRSGEESAIAKKLQR